MRYLWVLLLVGCVNSQAPFVPAGAQAWAPNAALVDSLWRSDEACSGLWASEPMLNWYLLPGRSFPSDVGQVAGYFDGDHSIYVAQDQFEFAGYNFRLATMRHELLHVLLQHAIGDADSQHTSLAWDACHARH